VFGLGAGRSTHRKGLPTQFQDFCRIALSGATWSIVESLPPVNVWGGDHNAVYFRHRTKIHDPSIRRPSSPSLTIWATDYVPVAPASFTTSSPLLASLSSPRFLVITSFLFIMQTMGEQFGLEQQPAVDRATFMLPRPCVTGSSIGRLYESEILQLQSCSGSITEPCKVARTAWSWVQPSSAIGSDTAITCEQSTMGCLI